MSGDKIKELGALLVAGLLALVAFSAINAPPPTSSEVAAWVQGLGSLAAVGVAAWVGVLPIEAERRRRHSERDDFLKALTSAADYAFSICELKSQATRSRNLSMIRDRVALLRRTPVLATLDKLLAEPLSKWPSAELFVSVRLFRDGVAIYAAFEGPSGADTLYPDLSSPYWLEADQHWVSVRIRRDGIRESIDALP